MPDRDHAESAIGKVRQWGTPSEKRKVYLYIQENFPELAKSSPIVSAWAARQNPTGYTLSGPEKECSKPCKGQGKILYRPRIKNKDGTITRPRVYVDPLSEEGIAAQVLSDTTSLIRGDKKRQIAKKKPSKKNPAGRKPRFVMLGDRVDLDIVDETGKVRTYKMNDHVAVATQPSMQSIFFVEVGEPAKANPGAAKSAWEQWTWGSGVDEVYSAARPTGKQVRHVGRIKRIYYDGRLAEQAEGQSRRVHEFKKPYPLLTVLEDGVTVTRGSGKNTSRYKITERGIIG